MRASPAEAGHPPGTGAPPEIQSISVISGLAPGSLLLFSPSGEGKILLTSLRTYPRQTASQIPLVSQRNQFLCKFA